MNRIIDANKVISVLEQLNEHSLTGSMNIQNALYLINTQPTAYDVDKVIEKFEHKIMSVRNSVYSNDKLQNESIKTIIINVISDLEDVVKGGGINE